MSGDDRERAFLDEVRRHLDDSVESLDPETRSALARARARALAAGERRALRWRWPAAAVAAAGAGALLLALWLRASPPEPPPIAARAPAEDPELIEELEFFTWLAEQPDAG